MNYYEGMLFFLCLIFILAGGFILGILEISQNNYILVVSALLAVFIIGKNKAALLYFLIFLAASLALPCIYLKLRSSKGRKAGTYHVFLLLAVLPLILCKVSAVFKGSIFAFTGISYLTFRSAQIIIEIYDGVITEISVKEMAAFLLFFPCLSSGPIDRSRRFHRDWDRIFKREEYLELCGKGLYKLLLGAVYKMVLAAAAYKLMTYLDTGTAWFHYIGYAYAYGLYLFFDFAGYSLMVIGTGAVLGVEVPDNFRLPFISRDIHEFWDRWHISLSHWFRDYIFTRFIMFSTRKKWFANRLSRACAGFFVNMGIMGIWHGITPSYIIYGIYHGALLAGTEVYQKKSSFYKKYKKTGWYSVLSWFITMQLVFLGFFIFSEKWLVLLQ